MPQLVDRYLAGEIDVDSFISHRIGLEEINRERPGFGSARFFVEDIAAGVPISFCCGSARRLDGGNWVMAWGSSPLVTEVSPTGAPVFELRFNGIFSYRAFPVEPGRLPASKLRAAMDVMHPR